MKDLKGSLHLFPLVSGFYTIFFRSMYISAAYLSLPVGPQGPMCVSTWCSSQIPGTSVELVDPWKTSSKTKTSPLLVSSSGDLNGNSPLVPFCFSIWCIRGYSWWWAGEGSVFTMGEHTVAWDFRFFFWFAEAWKGTTTLALHGVVAKNSTE